MWRWFALCVVLGGCQFHALATFDNGAMDAGDGSADAPAGTAEPRDCWPRWFEGAPGLALSAPQELMTLASAGDDRDPWISPNGLRLYFARDPGGGMFDILVASRASVDQEFGAPGPLGKVNTGDAEDRPALSTDEETLVFASNHGTGGLFHIFITTRADIDHEFPAPPGNQAPVAAINMAGINYYDPFLTRDGLRLYVAPIVGTQPQQIAVATRTSSTASFPASAPVPVINAPSGGDADPAVSPDDRVIAFSSHRGGGPGGTDLWYATRQSPSGDFTAPKLVPMVNDNLDDGDPVFSSDGCELYFASRRIGGKYHLFRAEVMK